MLGLLGLLVKGRERRGWSWSWMLGLLGLLVKCR